MALNNLLRKPHAHRSDAAVVSFEHVTVRYNGAPPALDDITFALQPGERARWRRADDGDQGSAIAAYPRAPTIDR